MTAPTLPPEVENALSLLETEIVPGAYGPRVVLYGVEELRAAIAAAIAPPADTGAGPVAWAVTNPKMSGLILHGTEQEARDVATMNGDKVVPLYAAPPAAPASVERRMAFMEVERRVEEAVKARDARIARMEEVLRFYARQSTWAGSYCATTGIHGEPDAYYDKGAKARAALDEWTAKS